MWNRSSKKSSKEKSEQDTNPKVEGFASAQAADDLWVTAYIGLDDGQVHGLMIERGTLVEELPQEEPVNG